MGFFGGLSIHVISVNFSYITIYGFFGGPRTHLISILFSSLPIWEFLGGLPIPVIVIIFHTTSTLILYLILKLLFLYKSCFT